MRVAPPTIRPSPDERPAQQGASHDNVFDATSFGAEAARQRHAEAQAAAAAAAVDPAQEKAFPSLGSASATTSKRRSKVTEKKLVQVLIT